MRAGEVRDPGEVSRKRRRGRPKTSYSSNITKWMNESMERITRDTRDRAEWRRLIRCAARAAGEDWCYVRHGRLIITPDGTVKEEEEA